MPGAIRIRDARQAKHRNQTMLSPSPADLIDQRQKFFADCEAFRLSHFELDPRLAVDYYAGYLLFTHYQNYPQQRLPALAAQFAAELRARNMPVYGAVKQFRPENLSHAGGGLAPHHAPQLLCGEMPPERFIIREFDLRFWVSFHAGFSTGLFLDIKHARQRVRTLVKPGDQVLNLFSYTGGFSLAAAKAGAARVIEVDSSAHWLNWSKENQKLNAVAAVRQRREEAVKFLSKQKSDAFDFIICDAPTYSSQKSGARFSVEKGFAGMLADFQRALRPGGYLLASTNSHRLPRRNFLNVFAARFAREEEIRSSEDFAGDDYLKVGIFRNRK